MFEWLEQEISEIKTPRFHVVDGPVDAKLREAVIASIVPVPSAYKEFVLKFGNARLYRDSRNGYNIGVFASPREAVLNDGTSIYHIGFNDDASVYVKAVNDSAPSPIFEFESEFEERVASGFEEWLSTACAMARKRYGKKKWAEILSGPRPFSAAEKEVIAARRLMRWEVFGVDADGNHIFKVTNAGSRGLGALTVGVRSKDKRLNGAVRLNVQNVGPGETALVHVDCYKDLVPPQDIEVFALPEANPEDRDFYWEFRNLNANSCPKLNNCSNVPRQVER